MSDADRQEVAAVEGAASEAAQPSVRRRLGPTLPARMPVGWRASAIFFGLAVLFLVVFCFVLRGSVWGNLVGTLPTFVMMLGMFLVGDGFRQRVGTEEYCAKCGYQRTQGGRPATDAARCPECGHAWWGWQGTVIGERRTSWVRVWLAAGCAVVWLVLLLGQFKGLNTFRLVPTFGLIEAAANHRGFDNQIWAAIGKRTLSPAQQRELVDALLEKRKGRRLSSDAGRWIEGAIAGGTVAPDQVRRYFEEMGRPRLILSIDRTRLPRVAVGERVDVHVIVDDDSNIFGAHTPFVYVRRLEASRDAAALVVPSGGWLYPHQASEEFAKPPGERIAGPASATRPPTITIRPESPGKITVLAEVYVVVWPGAGAPTLTTDPSGSPLAPAGVPFFSRFDLSLDVEVVPAGGS